MFLQEVHVQVSVNNILLFKARKNMMTFKEAVSCRHTEHYTDVASTLKSWLTLAQACKPYLGC